MDLLKCLELNLEIQDIFIFFCKIILIIIYWLMNKNKILPVLSMAYIHKSTWILNIHILQCLFAKGNTVSTTHKVCSSKPKTSPSASLSTFNSGIKHKHYELEQVYGLPLHLTPSLFPLLETLLGRQLVIVGSSDTLICSWFFQSSTYSDSSNCHLKASSDFSSSVDSFSAHVNLTTQKLGFCHALASTQL